MRIERCPSCAARYDTTTLEPGATFSCRRCGTMVVVGRGEPSEAPAPKPWGLIAVGALMLLGLFLYAHPTVGVRALKWPWEHWFSCGSPMLQADMFLWTATAVVALLAGLGIGGRSRYLALAPLAGLLLVRCYADPAAFHVSRMELHWMLCAVALGAGLAIQASGAEAGRGAGRFLALLGALGILAIYAVWRPDAQHREWVGYDYWRMEFTALLEGKILAQEFWDRLLPISILQVLAVLVGLALAAIPSARVPTLRRVAAIAGFSLLLLIWLEPLAAILAKNRESLFPNGRFTTLAGLLEPTWFDAGLGLWLVSSLSLSAIVRSRARAKAGAGGDPAVVPGGSAV